jgi:hypothetical protein
MREARNRVTVSPSPREAGNGWVLDAVFPNGKQAAIAGFRTQAEANDWLGSASHVNWLRDTRTRLCGRSAVALFEWLGSHAIAVAVLAAGFFKSICHRWDAIEAVRVRSRAISTISAQLRASEWLRVGSDLARRMSERRGAGQPSSVSHRTFYRRLLAAAVTLFMLVAVFVILLAVLVMLGSAEQPARLGRGATEFASGNPIVPPRSGEVTRASDPIALLIDRVSSSEIASELPTEAPAQTPSPQPAANEAPLGDIQAATPRRDSPRAAPPAIVGVWAPEKGSCSARNARQGVLPAIISEGGARAGDTSCVFKEQKRTEGDWRILANCTNGHERWTSNVRLTVKGDRLIWTSNRGTQAYTRCRSSI